MRQNSISMSNVPSRNYHGQEYALNNETVKRKRSITIITLLATCLFLFILVLCLITALLFVGKLSAAPSGYTIAKALDLYKIDNSIDGNNSNESFISAIYLKNRARNLNFDKVSDKQKFRLPNSVRPIYYDLYLSPNFDEGTFDGVVKISLKVLEPTKSIILHANKISISDYSLRQIQENGQNKSVNIIKAYEFNKNEYFVMESSIIEAGDYILDMNFNGSTANKLVGLYSSTYYDEESNARRY